MPDTYNKKEYTMKPSEVKRLAALYERHLKLLKLQGGKVKVPLMRIPEFFAE